MPLKSLMFAPAVDAESTDPGGYRHQFTDGQQPRSHWALPLTLNRRSSN